MPPTEDAIALRHRPGRRGVAPAAELVRLCLGSPEELARPRARRLLATIDPVELVPFARYHGVAGLLYEPMRDGAAPEPLLEALRASHDAAVHGHLRSTWELARVAAALADAGIAWVVVKGPAVVELLYAGAGGRGYRDLDLLVEPSDFRGALAALETAGYAPMDRNWSVLRREMRGEVHYRGESGHELDVHWNVVNMYRGRMRVSTGSLLRRSEPVELAGVAARTLDPTDTLIHLALHAAISGGDRILWLKDIERSVAVRPPDWSALVERSRAWRVGAPVGLLLGRAARFLGAAVPRSVTHDLLGPGPRWMVGAVDRLFPWEAALGRLASPNRLLARSIGQGFVGASAWLAVRSIRNLDPGQERAASAFTPHGDSADRAAFLAAVEASER
jgi:hypothetical protein